MAPAAARILVLVLAVATSLAGRADALRSLGVGDGGGAAAQGDYAVDLNATSFDAFLTASREPFAVVEFFAHWCPACRNYKPHYEKVAKLFNGPNAAHPGRILMARVDCASKHSSFTLDDKKYENENMLPNSTSDPKQVVQAIYDVEEATAHALQIILEHKMIKADTRDSLIRFLQILVAHHPSKRCRRGSAELLINFDDHWPSNLSLSSQDSSKLLESVAADNHKICGKEVPRGYWIFCRGSKSETRGFSVSVPFKSARDLSLWLWSTHNKVNERLMKEEKDMGTGDPSFPKAIWPPKALCPSCYRSSSRTSDGALQVDWNEDEVFPFLVNYYGKTLVSSYKETYMESLQGRTQVGAALADDASSSHAARVPIGAALGVAAASCTFGALACFWRTQQKNRKYSYRLHSLKKI
uniref:Sulfhydryl oxidase n=1 Tax=Aegilops tauschii TaxID=37682 RepID=R7VZY0_AEGTA